MINNKKVIAITLARGGSKSIPKKNIVDINGKPLIDYTTTEVRKSKFIDDYYISTDDVDIIEYCNLKNIKYIERPKHLASDTAKSSDALIHAVKELDCYYVVEVMATNPLKTVEDIDGCVETMDNKQVGSVVSVCRVFDHHPSRIKYLNEYGFMKDFYPEEPESRRQDLSPPAYVRNGSIYAMRKSYLLESGSRYTKQSLAYIMPNERTINIDEPDDLEMARIKLK